MSDSPQPKASSSGIEFTRDANFLIDSFIPMPSGEAAPPPYGTIPLPFCTPQIATSFDSPFARGYNPALESFVGVSQEQLLSFIDGLNLAMTSSPPLRVVNFAGMAIGFVPYHWAIIAGTVIQTAAQTGMHVLSKTLTDRYLRAANLRLFKPRGLSVRLCTTAAMQHLVMRTGNGAGPSTMHKIGRGVGTVLLHAPIPFTSRIVRAIADKPPKVPASINTVGDGKKIPLATQRRLASLEGYALPLDLNVPPPAKAQGVMDTMGSWGVAFDSWRTGRSQNKVEARRRELERINSQLQSYGYTPSPQASGYSGQPQMGGPGYGFPQPQVGGPGYGYPPNQSQMGGPSYGYAGQQQMGGQTNAQMELFLMGRRERKDLRKAARRARKRERGGGLISELIGPKETRLERRVANADLLESWATDKVLWVVIMSAELDKEIDGIERAESMDNEERVDQKTWQAEIVRERDELEEEEDEEEDDEDMYGDHKFGRSKEAPY
ncbi:hypothetical protein DFH07DRAFT_958508 [Mycena maculata]|uniref:Uncharacterized protein n=1 Tax=Mycena maculata TaxID=230809 RepID=A0AAD7JAI4_9AGAR|nr:hypothetical protein DFH07DRAFT_958508 [Mycena maculata]